MTHRPRTDQPKPLFGVSATRALEVKASARLPPHTLMARAGLATAQLARALVPHARCIWVACGPGNNGGDGLLAATHLHQWAQSTGGRVIVIATHASADPSSADRDTAAAPGEATQALAMARAAGVRVQLEPPSSFDLGIDAVFGIGLNRPISGRLGHWIDRLRKAACPVLCVDVPSGLHCETGMLLATESGLAETAIPIAITMPGPRHTLSFLTLKTGLFTASGRDAAGEVWLDDLGTAEGQESKPMAWLHSEPAPGAPALTRAHASHKGSFGDVLVLGGQDIRHSGEGMTGAAVLAARAALHAGAGRVYLALLGATRKTALRYDPGAPEIMLRCPDQAMASLLPEEATVVCGCGAGSALGDLLRALLLRSPRLVLDADALTALSQQSDLQEQCVLRAGRGWTTVLTPHPLEAARLLGTTTAKVMQDRLGNAQSLAERLGAILVLKGSGTVIAASGCTPRIVASGNARLATAGTGDVLAGMLGSALAAVKSPLLELAFARVVSATFQHGRLADEWEGNFEGTAGGAYNATLTASELARRARVLP